MDRTILATAAFTGMAAVILGAFGAHALTKVLDVHHQEVFETGVRYQIYHAFFLLFVGLSQDLSEKKKRTIYWLTVIGIILFSGSIYGLATQSLNGINFKAVGFLTPVGGLLLIVAWFLLFIDYLSKKS